MTRLRTWFVVGALGLGSAHGAFAQEVPCNPEWLRGVWLLTCDGFTDVSKIAADARPRRTASHGSR